MRSVDDENKCSPPFTLAVGALQRQLLIGDFLPERLKDPAVLEMARRVNYRFEEDQDVIALRPGIVEIKTKGGKVYTERVDYPYGHPRNPITSDDLIAKFKDCTSYSAKPLSEENLTRVIDMLLNLEKVKDVRELIDLVS